jgi:hypothetical protein
VDEGDLQRARYLLVSGSGAGQAGAFAESTEGLFALGGEAQVQLPERGAEARGVAEGNLEVDADGGVGEEVEVRDPAAAPGDGVAQGGNRPVPVGARDGVDSEELRGQRRPPQFGRL